MTTAERHYDDEALMALAAAGPAETASDLHLRACRPCAQTFETLRGMTASMQDATVWEPRLVNEEPRQETIDLLRKKQAEVWVTRLLREPVERWDALLSSRPHWQTSEMVLAMVGEAER